MKISTHHFTRRAASALLVALTFSAGLTTALAAEPAAPKVKFVTTEGDFVVEVYPDKAPKTVENFLQYVKDQQLYGAGRRL